MTTYLDTHDRPAIAAVTPEPPAENPRAAEDAAWNSHVEAQKRHYENNPAERAALRAQIDYLHAFHARRGR